MTTTTEKVTYTYEDVLAELQEIIKGREDYVYQAPESSEGTCVYFDDDEPSCLVGHWLAMHGITQQFFLTRRIPLSNTVKELFRVRSEVMPMNLDDSAYCLLLIAQQKQDMHWRWGQAVEYASRAALTEAEYTS